MAKTLQDGILDLVSEWKVLKWKCENSGPCFERIKVDISKSMLVFEIVTERYSKSQKVVQFFFLATLLS